MAKQMALIGSVELRSQERGSLSYIGRGKSHNRVCAEVRVSLQHLPVLVASDQGDLLNFQPCFEEPACAFVAQVVEVQVLDIEVGACASEGGSD